MWKRGKVKDEETSIKYRKKKKVKQRQETKTK